MSFLQPVGFYQTSIEVVNSRFICSIDRVTSVTEVKHVLAQVRSSMPDASHHVYAFRVGHGNSVIEGLSDDGEPSGTAGPPVMAVLRGSDIGNIVAVITRYFGGTKLGTGGLVRAYSDAVRTGLASLPTELNIARQIIGIQTPYPLYELVKRLLEQYECTIEDETFAADVTLIAKIPVDHFAHFRRALLEVSDGRVEPLILQ